MTHAILMGDPSYFSVVGGANPHTRDRYGRRKNVDRELAISQWRRMRDLLVDHGLQVEVVPANPELPGLVYPANAGVRIGPDFVLSNLTPTRCGEQPVYRAVVEGLGIPCHTIERPFEGEADLFPAGDCAIFTYGTIRRQRFVARLGWPPWRRVYGFRSDPAALEEIESRWPLGGKVLKIELVDERYYHGDTCLCAFGPDQSGLLAYLPVIAPSSRALLRQHFGERIIELDDADAAIYAANSFAFSRDGQSFLVMPEGVSEGLVSRVRQHDSTVLSADVSEFHKKGGGSVKCMIGDLGEIS